jgi:lipoprotein-releasing system ATP-binding protein
MADIALKATAINKYFHDPVTMPVLKNVSMEVNKGEFVSIVGKSGCGKSTLLYVLSTMDTDYEGTLEINGIKATGRTLNDLAALRNESIGFVFQFHYLLPDFSCLKNVMIPGLKLGKYSYKEIEQKAYEKLKMFGVEDQALKKANKLSGGQQQRVAIARALINDPTIIMGDEPTGNLDSKNTGIVFDLFQKLTHDFGQTIITVTHDEDFAKRSDRIIEMADGVITSHGHK